MTPIPPSRRVPRGALAGLLVGTLAVGGLAACTPPWSGSGAEDAADALARGLARGSLEDVAVAGDRAAAQEQLAAVVADLDLLGRPQVAVGDVETEDDRATAGWAGGGRWATRSGATTPPPGCAAPRTRPGRWAGARRWSSPRSSPRLEAGRFSTRAR